MKNLTRLIVLIVLSISQSYAFDIKLLANNKESFSRELSKEDVLDAQAWEKSHHFNPDELRARSLRALSKTFNEMETIDTNCELGLITRLQLDAKSESIIHSNLILGKWIGYLRNQDLIDDILYRLLMDAASVQNKMETTSHKIEPQRPYNLYTRHNADVDLAKTYSSVKNWPDDISKCSIDAFWSIAQNVRSKNSKDRDNQLLKLNYLAYINGHISLTTYNKLEVLREKKVLDWNIYFNRYADLINNAKDKLTKNPEVKAQNNFSVEYVSRRRKLTNRENLYMTYSSTQVMMLAQIIEKTAKRMDSKNVSLNWQYTEDPKGETEVYIFSPMEQYRAAIKMLRKDMGEVMRSDAFRGIGLEFEHLIAAAYEAGFIRSEELDYVLKFEELWNPKVPKWKTYTNFAFSLAGSASFYLPPPFNIIGAIGLVLTQSRLVKGDEQPDPNDNWNVII